MKTYKGDDKINGIIWYDYSVIQRKPLPSFEYESKECKVKIYVTKQDGVWVGSYEYDIDYGCVSGFNPGRKWGEFDSKEEAEEYYCTQLIRELKKVNLDNRCNLSNVIKALEEYYQKIWQYDLFQ